MRRLPLGLLVAHLICLTAGNVFAQSTSTDSSKLAAPSLGVDRSAVPGVFDMITNLPTDWYQFAKQNVTVSKAPLIVGCAALTAALIVVDRPTWLPFKQAYETNTPVKRLSDGLVFLGDGKFQFGLAGAFGIYGLLAPKSANADRALRTASQTAEVILACGAVVQLLKHITGRESPIVATERNGRWRFFPNQIEYANNVPHFDAFPSGHLATATATLLVISNNYPEVSWIRPFGYVVLGGIATSLVTSSIHWWSDFPLGFALGYAFGTLLSPATKTSASTDQSSVSAPSFLDRATLYPTVVAGSTGVGISVGF